MHKCASTTGAMLAVLLLKLSACSDPTDAPDLFRVTIEGPAVVQADVHNWGDYETYECRFDLVARASGSEPEDRVYLSAPTAELRLSNGETKGYSMLSGWENRQIASGEEVRGQFYLDAIGPFDAELTSSWTDPIEHTDVYGNTITLSCH